MKKNFIICAIIFICSFSFYKYARGIWYPVSLKIIGKRTVAQVIEKYSEKTKQELSPLFFNVGLSYPPKKISLLVFKDSNILEVWAASTQSEYSLIKSYPIKAASGVLGPKLREGDRQVPEGIYRIDAFNPNSSYHLSMKLNYPNVYDLKHAREEGRNEPGSDIFIHGRSVSIGCLAMGDKAIEQLFTLIYETGIDNTAVLISPTDPSKNELVVPNTAPLWTNDLYQKIKTYYSMINTKYK